MDLCIQQHLEYPKQVLVSMTLEQHGPTFQGFPRAHMFPPHSCQIWWGDQTDLEGSLLSCGCHSLASNMWHFCLNTRLWSLLKCATRAWAAAQCILSVRLEVAFVTTADSSQVPPHLASRKQTRLRDVKGSQVSTAISSAHAFLFP